LIQRLADEVERLDSRLHEAQEVYAGFEGFIPQTAPEDYCMRIIREMAHALMGVSQPQPQTPGQTHEPSQPASDDRQADQEKKP
jgi:hypothetical protein